MKVLCSSRNFDVRFSKFQSHMSLKNKSFLVFGPFVRMCVIQIHNSKTIMSTITEFSILVRLATALHYYVLNV